MTVADDRAPALGMLLAECTSLASRAIPFPDGAAARGRDGGGRPVVTLPGFMTHDLTSWRLRATLALAGYAPTASGIGLNLGFRDHTLPDLERLVEGIAERTGMTVSLIGWSLGGLFAREFAKLRPDLVDRVVTLASPFSGDDPRANNGWRLYEMLSGMPMEQAAAAMDLRTKPPVPTFAVWTPNDGVVAPASARGLEGERDVAIEVRCRHLEMVSDHRALVAVLDALEADASRFTRRDGPAHHQGRPA